jgi:hypothetical protein
MSDPLQHISSAYISNATTELDANFSQFHLLETVSDWATHQLAFIIIPNKSDCSFAGHASRVNASKQFERE